MAARAAADAIGAQKGAQRPVSLVRGVATNVHAIREMPMDVPGSAKAKLLHEAYAAAKSASPLIAQVSAQVMDRETDVIIANSEGLMVADKRVYSRMGINAVASENGENQTGFIGPGAQRGFEFFREGIDPEAAARSAAQTALTMLRAEHCPAGTMPVIIDGGFGGVILHEACVHSLEATSVAKGNSEFCGKLGQKIASDVVTAVDDGTMPGEWGTIHVDDEGMPSQRNVLIENGVLKSYLVDLLGSRLMNHPRTGSARRQGYTFAPTSRMTNTFFAPGTDDEEEMLRTMGEGLFAKAMGGGSVNPLTGEFNFSVREAYWVKDGKIFCPVRGATLVGRGADVLMQIDRIGRDMWMSPGMCGSLSGSVPTNVGQPRIRVRGITVGGKGGAL